VICSPHLKVLFASLEERGREDFDGGKYAGKWRNLLKNLKE